MDLKGIKNQTVKTILRELEKLRFLIILIVIGRLVESR